MRGIHHAVTIFKDIVLKMKDDEKLMVMGPSYLDRGKVMEAVEVLCSGRTFSLCTSFLYIVLHWLPLSGKKSEKHQNVITKTR